MVSFLNFYGYKIPKNLFQFPRRGLGVSLTMKLTKPYPLLRQGLCLRTCVVPLTMWILHWWPKKYSNFKVLTVRMARESLSLSQSRASILGCWLLGNSKMHFPCLNNRVLHVHPKRRLSYLSRILITLFSPATAIMEASGDHELLTVPYPS